MKFRYEELEIWQIAMDLIAAYYPILRRLPGHELYALAAQGRRAAVSVALNIAEGSGRKTDKDFALFINRAVTSLQEADAVLKTATRLDYLTDQDYQTVSPLIEREYYKLVAFEKALYRVPSSRRRYAK